MKGYSHGGAVWGRSSLLDFSVNLNPMGIPPCAIEAGQEAVSDGTRYPDPFCTALRQAISARDGVPTDWILCGNGASDLIFRLGQLFKGKQALIAVPTFSEYEIALKTNICKVKAHYMYPTDDFVLNDRFLSDITPDVRLVFLCDPNNPTGKLIDLTLLDKILQRCRQVGALLVVDQCFLELTVAPYDRLVHQLEGGNLLLLRALTKSYAMAGLRLGYCLCSDGELLDSLSKLGQPWSVSAPAQAAGEAALRFAPHWPKQAVAILEEERRWLSQKLRTFGFFVCPSDVNFILFYDDKVDWKERLLSREILIRDCSNFEGLNSGWYRVAIKLHEDNVKLIEGIQAERGED